MTAPTLPHAPHIQAAHDQYQHCLVRSIRLKAELDKAIKSEKAAQENIRSVEKEYPQEAASYALWLRDVLSYEASR